MDMTTKHKAKSGMRRPPTEDALPQAGTPKGKAGSPNTPQTVIGGHNENGCAAPPLRAVYRALHRAWGPQHWWPARTRFEMIVGAILTQNTAWLPDGKEAA